jgi:hypothetical protein
MRDPVRLIHSSELAPWERELLQSAREETPEGASLRTLLACLPPEAVLTHDGALGRGDNQPPSAELAPRTAAPNALPLGKAALSLKTVLTVTFGFGLTGAIGWATLNSNAAPPSAAPRTDTTALPASIPTDPPGIGAAEAHPRKTAPYSSERATPPVPVQPSPNAQDPDTTRRAATAEPASSLTDEVQALEQVRRTLRAGDQAEARILLNEYRTRFPQGALGPEARALEESVQTTSLPRP